MPHAVLGIGQTLQNPLFWAVFVGWIMSVVLHEFAHGLVAHWGGDYTIRERGGLSLNPLQYVDPVNSLLLPAIFLAIGGVALPGGVTFVRTDLLRSKWWDSAVSLAGPAMNLVLFLVGAALLHPRFGPMAPPPFRGEWTPAQMVVASLTMLQLFSVLLNLIPLPPLDGFGALHPLLPPRTQAKLNNPSTRTGLTVVLFLVVFSGGLFRPILDLAGRGLLLVGYDRESARNVELVTRQVVFGRG